MLVVYFACRLKILDVPFKLNVFCTQLPQLYQY